MNRLDETDCPELDALTSVTKVANLKDALNDSFTVLDSDFVMWREGEVYPVGSVHIENGLAFMLLNPVY